MSRVLRPAIGLRGQTVYLCLEDVVAIGPAFQDDITTLRQVYLVGDVMLELQDPQPYGPLSAWFTIKETPMQTSGTVPALTTRTPKGKGKKR